MRNKYKNNKQKNKLYIHEDNNEFNKLKIAPINTENKDVDYLNNLQQRNTISVIHKNPILYKNFRLHKNLQLNNLEPTNIRENNTIASQINKSIDINKDKKDLKIIKRKSFFRQNVIIVNKPHKLRNKLYINKMEIVLKTNPNINTNENLLDGRKNINNRNNIEDNNISDMNKNTNLTIDNKSHNDNFKKIEVNLIKNKLKTINKVIKTERYSENKSTYLNTDINIQEDNIDNINKKQESNDLLSFDKKYKIKSIDKKINIENNNMEDKERITDNNMKLKYINTETHKNSRNKIERSPFKLLVHRASNNSNLSEIFNKMYNSYLTHRSVSKSKHEEKSLNRYSSKEKKLNINDSSINDKNTDLNNIAKILKEFGNEKIKKKHSKIITCNQKIEESGSNFNKEMKIEEREGQQFNLANKIINNNTYNTTFNIYKINNIITKKVSNQNRKNNIIKLSESYFPRTMTETNNEKDNKRNENESSQRRLTSFREQDDIYNKKIHKNYNEIDIETIYIFISKFKEIVIRINNYEPCYTECNDLILFLFENDINKLFINSFKIPNNAKTIINIIKAQILSLFLYYNSRFYKNFVQAGILIKTIFNLLNNNFLIMISYIINNDIKLKRNNTYFKSLLNDLKEYIKKELNQSVYSEEIQNENKIINLIEQNIKQINNYYQMIIDNLFNSNLLKKINAKDMKNDKKYRFPKCLSLEVDNLNINQNSRIISNFFFDAFKSLNIYNINDLKIFYETFLTKEKTSNEIIKNNKKVVNYQKYKNGYYRILNSNLKLNKANKYYLPPIKSIYKYSLLINLDALMCEQNKFYKEKFQITQIRPSLVQFLKEMKQFYELILFSSNNFDYISNKLKLFENDENKYFEHILSNFDIIIKSDGSIENIDLLGRNINSIIFIDQIKSLHINKNTNIIYLKKYYGDINYDKNILVNLMDILKKIKNDVEQVDDIRVSLDKYKFFIFTKTTNLLF